MSPLRLSGSTSGFSQIDAPAVAGDQTFTLPGTGGTLDRLNRAGNILQVVNATYSTFVAVASTSYTDAGLSASITPTSSSSKVLVIVSQPIRVYRASNTGIIGGARILRGGTSILEQIYSVGIEAGLSGIGQVILDGSFNGNCLDSPATTSSVTYKIQIRADQTAQSGQAQAQANGSTSSIMLLEVAA